MFAVIWYFNRAMTSPQGETLNNHLSEKLLCRWPTLAKPDRDCKNSYLDKLIPFQGRNCIDFHAIQRNVYILCHIRHQHLIRVICPEIVSHYIDLWPWQGPSHLCATRWLWVCSGIKRIITSTQNQYSYDLPPPPMKRNVRLRAPCMADRSARRLSSLKNISCETN